MFIPRELQNRVIRNLYQSHLKHQLIINQDYKTIGKFSYFIYKYEKEQNYSMANFYQSAINHIEKQHNQQYVKVAVNLSKGRSRKSKNIKERIISMITETNQAYFITFTFDDSTLATTNQTTRRKYITRVLKSTSEHYLANIDFGEKTHREHYHAVTTHIIPQEFWIYGYIKCIPIGHRESEPAKVGKYITKLNNHALKPSTHGKTRFQPIIYSRTRKD